MDWVTKLLIGYVLKVLQGIGDSPVWPKLHQQARDYLAPLLPDFLEPAVFSLLDGVLDVVALAFKDTADLTVVVQKLASGDVVGAIDALIELVKNVTHPHAPALILNLVDYKAKLPVKAAA